MADKPSAGELFGIPYNFDRPSVSRLISSYWQPGERMVVRKPFGIGYTLNLANWRSWIVLGVVGVLMYLESRPESEAEDGDAEPIEIVVDDD